MAFFTRLALLLVGVATGLGATDMLTSGQSLVGTVRSGPWTTWPGAGAPKPDPYARAVAARDGHIPLATGAGLRFLAETDSAGDTLDGRCDYRVGGPTPQAQFWTLTLLNRRGFAEPNALDRFGFTSAELMRDGEGNFVVEIAAAARPGNWLPAPPQGSLTLMLSFYDTALARGMPSGAGLGLPTIQKSGCR